MAIQRLLHEHGLLHPRRRYQKKQDLAALKATWALFQQISADTKDLDDIPPYWPQMKALGLPAVQYTAREVRSGLQFLADAAQRSARASELFAQRIQTHLQRCGIVLRDLTWQTDNGAGLAARRLPFPFPGRRHLLRLATRADPAGGPPLPVRCGNRPSPHRR